MSHAPSWLSIVPVESDKVQAVTDDLDLGERVAIALAGALHAGLLLIDEAAGCAEAIRRNLRVTGTLGVLRAARPRSGAKTRRSRPSRRQSHATSPRPGE
jgi:predicted nucleic acid-binding protein